MKSSLIHYHECSSYCQHQTSYDLRELDRIVSLYASGQGVPDRSCCVCLELIGLLHDFVVFVSHLPV